MNHYCDEFGNATLCDLGAYCVNGVRLTCESGLLPVTRQIFLPYSGFTTTAVGCACPPGRLRDAAADACVACPAGRTCLGNQERSCSALEAACGGEGGDFLLHCVELVVHSS